MTPAERGQLIASCAAALDPAAFEHHELEERSLSAALQWGARRRIAFDMAERLLASEWWADQVTAVRVDVVAKVREHACTCHTAEYSDAAAHEDWCPASAVDDELLGLDDVATLARPMGHASVDATTHAYLEESDPT
jgi:hypothetical protein